MLRRNRSRGGLTVLEFVIAMTLILMVFTGSAQVLATSSAALVEGRARDGASLVAYRVLEKSRAMGCGYGVELSQGPTGAVQTTAELAQRCKDSIFESGDPSAADADVTIIGDSNSRPYPVRYRTSWHHVQAPAGQCAPPSMTSLNFTQPTLLRRVITVQWSARDIERPPIVSESLETVTADSPRVRNGAGSTGAVVVKRAPNVPVTLVAGSLQVTRHTDKEGCAWFPYLPYGAYTVGGTSVQLDRDNRFRTVT